MEVLKVDIPTVFKVNDFVKRLCYLSGFSEGENKVNLLTRMITLEIIRRQCGERYF